MTVVEVLKAARAKIAQNETSGGCAAIEMATDDHAMRLAAADAFLDKLELSPEWNQTGRLLAFDRAIAAEEAKS